MFRIKTFLGSDLDNIQTCFHWFCYRVQINTALSIIKIKSTTIDSKLIRIHAKTIVALQFLSLLHICNTALRRVIDHYRKLSSNLTPLTSPITPPPSGHVGADLTLLSRSNDFTAGSEQFYSLWTRFIVLRLWATLNIHWRQTSSELRGFNVFVGLML